MKLAANSPSLCPACAPSRSSAYPFCQNSPPKIMQTLGTIPQEVLEHIAFFVATLDDLGPPSGLIPLLSANRRINSLLSASANPHLYARIFTHKFDTAAARRRLRSEDLSALALCDELRRRCALLKRIRNRLDSKYTSTNDDADMFQCHEEEEQVSRVLWMAYFMMLENDGKNERQLREYAGIDGWLKEFWFDRNGASRTMLAVTRDEWPSNHEVVSLGMWLFWLLLKPGECRPSSIS